MKYSFALVAAMSLAPAAVMADVTQDVIDGLKDEGYTHIEIERGATELKVEATRDGVKLERIIDRETGDVLKEEIGEDDGDGHHSGGDDDDDDEDDGDDHGGHGGDDHGDGGDDHGGGDGDSSGHGDGSDD